MTNPQADEIAKDIADWFLPDRGNTTETPNTLLRVEIAKALTEYGDAKLDEAAKVALETFPRGSAHTYASENADLYHAQEETCETIAHNIKALKSGEEKRV